MKKWTGIPIFLVVLILVSYYVMGFIVKSTLNKNINAIPKTSLLTVQLDKYERGLFSSHAVFIIKMHIPPQAITDRNGKSQVDQSVDFDLSFPIIINHGPFIITDDGLRFGMGQATTQPQTHYGVLINYFNETIFKYTLPSFSINGKVGSSGDGDFQFEWLGLNAILCISPNIDKLEGSVNLNGLNGAYSNGGFKVDHINNYFKLTRSPEGLFLGHTHITVPSVEVRIANNKIFDLKGFDWAFNSNINDGSLNFNFDISLQKLFADKKNYGPGSFKLTLKNLDPKVMANINKQELKLLEANGDPSLAMLAILAELPKLLNKGPELELAEMTFNLPEGMIKGNLKISLPQSYSSDPNQLLQKAHGKGEFKAPMNVVKKLLVASIKDNLSKKADKSAQEPSTSEPRENTTESSLSSVPTATNYEDEALKEADKTLQDWISKGIIIVEGNDYVLHFKFDNGQVTVNGKPFNPGMLQ